jgi:hypothetical protein
MFAGLSPPGSRWYRNPGNQIAGMVKTAGELVGYAVAKAEELRANFLPDQAYQDVIARWEGVLKIASKPRDSLDSRRTRVIAFLSRLRGYSIPAIQQILSGPLDCDTSDVQILQYSNLITDALSSLNAQRWSAGPAGTWSIVGGQLQVAAASTVDLTQYPGAPCYLRTPIPQSTLRNSPRGAGAVVAQVEVASIASLDNQSLIGLTLFDRVSNDALWFGVKQISAHRALGYTIWQGGIEQAFVTLVSSWTTLPLWLRVRPQTLQDGSFEPILGYSTTSATTGFTETSGVSFTINPPNNAGVGVIGGNMSGALQATFANFAMLAYDGDRPYSWFTYRDPALGGSPDITTGQLLLSASKPAHTRAGVCQNTSVLCDDTRDGLCDRGPLGGL